MIVWPTVLMDRNGTGAPARHDSFMKMNCSTGPKPRPPYSSGQPTPSQRSRPIWRTASRHAGLAGLAGAGLGADLGRHQLGEVGAQLLLQRFLLIGIREMHAIPLCGSNRGPEADRRRLEREHVLVRDGPSAPARRTCQHAPDR